MSMAMTEHHFVLLFSDRVKVIRMLDDRVVYEEPLDIVSGPSAFGFSFSIIRTDNPNIMLVKR